MVILPPKQDSSPQKFFLRDSLQASGWIVKRYTMALMKHSAIALLRFLIALLFIRDLIRSFIILPISFRLAIL
jgi:hypothetical protein